jgi:protease-4
MSSPVSDGIVRGITHAVILIASVFAGLAVIGVVMFAISFGVGAGMAGATMGPGSADGFVHLSGERNSKNKLLAVRVEGLILGAPPRDRSAMLFLSGVTYGYEVQQVLEDAVEKDEVKGVLLHLQTPGGTIFGARAIDDGIKRYRDRTKKPVVAYIEGLSASGGVMAMVGASKIYADYGSLIGSIGVLGPQLLFFNKPLATDGSLLESGIVTQNGIEQTVISAGRGKDLGNPFRRPTDEEVATLTRGVEAEYEQFVQHVARSRQIETTTIKDKMGAMIFDNAAAQAYGLIDGTASRGDTIARLAEMAGVGKDFQVVRPGEDEGGLVRKLLAAATALRAPTVQVSAAELFRREVCSIVRAPLVYYGDPSMICR